MDIETKKLPVKETVDTLNISEHFYSVQGEGRSTGYPAYFMRLRGCNLICGGKDGCLVKEGKATWWCDTEYVWRQGVKTTFDDVVDSWTDQGVLDWILDGRIHIIWTGGEPTLIKHQEDIIKFISYLGDRYEDRVEGFRKLPLYNEIETNGTQYITDDLMDELDQINCSVKLENSGMSKAKRFCAGSLKRIMEHPNYWFKFVISNEDDLREIEDEFVHPLDIPPSRVLMMPGLDSQENYHERTRFCLEMAKKYGYVGLTRLHVSAWDKTTGV